MNKKCLSSTQVGCCLQRLDYLHFLQVYRVEGGSNKNNQIKSLAWPFVLKSSPGMIAGYDRQSMISVISLCKPKPVLIKTTLIQNTWQIPILANWSIRSPDASWDDLVMTMTIQCVMLTFPWKTPCQDRPIQLRQWIAIVVLGLFWESFQPELATSATASHFLCDK